MANLGNFDARTVEPSDSFDPIPAGWYLAAIVKSENKPTKDRTGEYLELTFHVVQGPYKGRQAWARLNLKNPNATAVKIARGELSAICRAVGVMTPRDSEQLHDRPLEIKVACKRREDNGEMANEIKGFRGRSGTGQPAAQTPNPAHSNTAQGVPPRYPTGPQHTAPQQQQQPQYQPQQQPQPPHQPQQHLPQQQGHQGHPAPASPDMGNVPQPGGVQYDESGRPIDQNGDIAPWE